MKPWLAVCLLLLVALARAETISFAAIGDTPYSARERAQLPGMLKDIADSGVDFVIHVGDIKGGQERCDDNLFVDRLRLFDASRLPFVYVPGDNEWTDCDRLSNGSYDPLERLNKLRSLFWPFPETLGQKRFRVERQPGASYPEHFRFKRGGVLFVSLNIPGSNNNWGMTEVPSAEFQQRNPVVLTWMKDSFAQARAEKLSAIVLLFQANPGFKHYTQGLSHQGYAEFLNLLRKETSGFDGEVIAVHGDTHISRVDHPMLAANGKAITSFTRVETFGYPYMGWTKLSIDPDAASKVRIEQHPYPKGK